MGEIEVFDDVLPDPGRYRRRALTLAFGDVEAAGQTFRGIALCPDLLLPYLIQTQYKPGSTPLLSFFRQSPAGQAEPNYIHSDVEMGDWTAILYLNPDPPAGDGTTFWRHRPTGADRGAFDLERQGAREQWAAWHHVEARFNRLLIFHAPLYHSRAIEANYGQAGVDARLTQIVFAGV